MKIASESFAQGLGDNIILTSIIKFFPNKLTVQLPMAQSRFSILFDGLAQVELCQEKDLIPLGDTGVGHYALTKLRTIFGRNAENMDIRPLVLYSDPESNNWAAEYLKDKPNPIIICPFVAKKWANVRDIPLHIVKEIILSAKLRKQTPIVVQSDSDMKWNCDTLNNLELKKLICLMRQVGSYVGANTGTYHLAVAVGAQVTCYMPPDSPLFQSSEWTFKHPTIRHITW